MPMDERQASAASNHYYEQAMREDAHRAGQEYMRRMQAQQQQDQ